MEWNIEKDLAELLNRLSGTQQKLLELLARKRDMIIRRDHAALERLNAEELELGTELQACHERRQELLVLAAEQGMPSASISALVKSLPTGQREQFSKSMQDTQQRSKLLRHQCLSQWVAMQKTMLHLSHLLEIIATRGQLKPTYGRGATSLESGALMDRAI